MDTTNNRSADSAEKNTFSLKEFIKICVSKWVWFLISIVVFIGGAVFYILTRQPEYERSEEILIKDQDAGGSIGDIASVFSSFGLISSSTSVYNELISLKSPAVMYEVAKRLHLDINYDKLGGFHAVTLYGETLPVIVDMKGIGEQEGASFKMELRPDGSVLLYKFVRHTLDGKEKLDGEVELPIGQDSIHTPIGLISLSPNPGYKGEKIKENITLKVSKSPMQFTVEEYGEKLNAELVDRDADVIGLSIRDVCVQRAVDILNLVLVVYNENWIEDKNKIAVATSAFIDERLRLIQEELGNVDSQLAHYSTKIGTPSLIATAEMSMEKEAKLSQNVIELENQLALAQYMKDFLDNSDNSYKIIPVNTGIDNVAIEKDIETYNSLLLTRNNLVSNSSTKNPLVEDYDYQLRGMRESIVQSVANQVTGLKTLLGNVTKERNKIGGHIAGTAEKALPILSEERQQKVKEGLYLFLLQKREENELTQKFTADNNRVITPPMGSLKPVSPKKKLIIASAFLLSLLLPTLIIYFIELSNTKVRGKKDLESLKMPFAGEIPHVDKKQALKSAIVSKKLNGKDEKAPLVVVEEGKRDVVNEAFRVIRGNLDFMKGRADGCQTILLTSFNPGSGKSFISFNLGLSFSLRKKRVLVIDCDLRHGSSSLYVGMPSKGLSDYLTSNTDDWKSLVKISNVNSYLSVLPIGKMPPNPVELLENGRFGELVEMAKQDYDYILLDCPPVDIVVDSNIVGKYADRTLFIIRSGLLEKSAIAELNTLYDEKKYKNMSVILNGTEAIHSRYYTYGNYQNV